MFNFTKKNINIVIAEIKDTRKDYIEKIKKEKGIKKITKRLPNFFTKSRFISPLLILPATLSGNMGLSLIIISLFAATDLLDGLCARTFNAYSEYGRRLDTISDKIFSLGIALPILFVNPSYALSTIVLEGAISLVNVNSELKQNQPHSTNLGKLKTWLTFSSLISCYAMGILNLPKEFIKSLLVLTNITQTATLTQYIYLDKKRSEEKIKEKIELIDNSPEVKEELSDTKKKILEYTEIKENLLILEEYKNINNNEKEEDKRITKTIS